MDRSLIFIRIKILLLILKGVCCARVDLKIWTSGEPPNYVSPFYSKDNLRLRDLKSPFLFFHNIICSPFFKSFSYSPLPSRAKRGKVFKDSFTFPSQRASSSRLSLKKSFAMFLQLLRINLSLSLKPPSGSQPSTVTSWEEEKACFTFPGSQFLCVSEVTCCH